MNAQCDAGARWAIVRELANPASSEDRSAVPHQGVDEAALALQVCLGS